jgi:hypothetical protein
MPPAFIASSSRSISGFVTAGPNHHHRIMMRLSSGGVTNERRRASRAFAWRGCALGTIDAATARTNAIARALMAGRVMLHRVVSSGTSTLNQ